MCRLLRPVLLISILATVSSVVEAARLIVHVRDHAGHGLGGATVSLVVGGEAMPGLVADAKGNVALDISPGRYRAAVSAEGFVPWTTAVFVMEENTAKTVTVSLFPGAMLSGQVVDADGRPIADAQLCLSANRERTLPPEAFGNDLFTDNEYCETSDSRGALATAVLPHGPYELTLEADGRVPLRSTLDLGGDRDGMRWTLRSGGSITGRVQQPDEQPVAGAPLRLQHREREVERDGLTDDDGRFLVTGLAPGAWSLRIEPRAAAAIRRDGIEVDEGGKVDLGLIRTRRGLDIEGWITDADGNSVPGVTIFARAGARMNRLLREAESDDEGRFIVAGLGEEPVNLIVDPPDGFAAVAIEDVTPPDRTLEIELAETGEICGTVVDEDGLVPAGVSVSSVPAGDDLIYSYQSLVWVLDNAVDPDDGSFCLTGVYPGDETPVSASAPGYLSVTESVSVSPGDRLAHVDLVLKRGLTLEGLVVNAEGQPVGEAAVRTGSSRAVHTNRFGEFRLSGLPRGPRRIIISHVDYARTERNVTLPQPEDQELVIELERGGVVEGSVKRSSGQPVDGIRISVSDDERITDLEGRYRFEHVAGGENTVTRRARGAWDDFEQRRVEIVAGQTHTVDFTLGEVLEGQVLRGGVPLPGVSLTLARPEQIGDYTSGSHGVQRTWTDETGRYRLAGAQAGWATLTVDTGGNRVVRPVEVPPGEEPRMDVHLPEQLVTGRVIAAADERPLAGADVQAELSAVGGAPPGKGNSSYSSSNAEGGIRYNLTMSSSSSTRSAGDGSFSLYVESAPEVQIGAWLSGYKYLNDKFSPAVPVELRLKRSISLTVNVRDTQGNPLPRIQVCAMLVGGGSTTCNSGRTGSAPFSLEEGSYVLLASAEGFATDEQEHDLVADPKGTDTIDVTLVPGAPLVIRLVGQASTDEPKVILIDPEGRERSRLTRRGTVDPATGDRRWETWPLRPGLWTVSIETGGEAFRREVEVVAGPRIEVVLP